MLLVAFGSFGTPFVGWCALVVSLWLVLELWLACWMGPLDVTLHFCVVWFRFRLLRRYLALWPSEVGWVHRLLEMMGEGCPGRGPIHLLSASAVRLVFVGTLMLWLGPGLCLAIWLDLCGRRGFRGGPFLDIHGSLQLLYPSHVREKETRPCFAASWLGCLVWFSSW